MIREVIIPENIHKRLRSKKGLPHEVKKQFVKRIGQLIENDRHPSLRHKPIQGVPGYWEFSINMNYRCVYRKESTVAIIVAIAKHEDVF